MNWNTKYIGEAKSFNNKDVKVELMEWGDNSYTPIPFYLTPDGLNVEYNTSDVIKGKTLDLTLVIEDEVIITSLVDDLINAKYRIRLSYNNEVVYIGYPDDAVMNISVNNPQPIQLSFTDGFARLKESLYENPKNINIPLINYIIQGLQNIGLNYPLYINAQYFDVNMNNILSTDTTFNRTYLNDLAVNKGDGDTMNYYDIIEGILTSFNLSMYSVGEKIVIDENKSFLDSSEVKKFVKYIDINIDGVVSNDITSTTHIVDDIFSESTIDFRLKKKGFSIETERKEQKENDSSSINNIIDGMNSNDNYFSVNVDKTNLFNQLPFKYYKHQKLNIDTMIGDNSIYGDTGLKNIYTKCELTEINGVKVGKFSIIGHIFDVNDVNFCGGVDNTTVLTINGDVFTIKGFSVSESSTQFIIYHSDYSKVSALKNDISFIYEKNNIQLQNCYLVSSLTQDQHIIIRPNSTDVSTLYSDNGVMGLYYNSFFKVDPNEINPSIKVDVSGHFYNEFDLNITRATYLPLLIWIEDLDGTPKFLKKNTDGVYYLSTDFKAVPNINSYDDDSGFIKIREGVKYGVDQPFTATKEIPLLSIFGLTEMLDKELKIGVVIGFPHRKVASGGWELDANGNDLWMKLYSIKIDLPKPPETNNVFEYIENENIGGDIEKVTFEFGDIDSFNYTNGYCYDSIYTNRTSSWLRNVLNDNSGSLPLDERYAMSKEYELDYNSKKFNFSFFNPSSYSIKEYDVIDLKYKYNEMCTIYIDRWDVINDKLYGTLVNNIV